MIGNERKLRTAFEYTAHDPILTVNHQNHAHHVDTPPQPMRQGFGNGRARTVDGARRTARDV
jgi:hypothetical protein